MSDGEVGRITASLDIDSDDFESKMDDAQSKAESFPDIEPKLTLDDSDYTDKIDEATQKADDLAGRDISVPISASDDASNALDDISTKADELSSKEVDVPIRAEGADEAQASIEGVESSLNSLQGMMETVGEIALFAGAIAAADELYQSIQGDIEAFGELQYASEAASLKSGGTATSPEIQALADQLAVQMGRPSSEIASVIGTMYGWGERNVTAQNMMPAMNLGYLPGVGMENATNLVETSVKRFGVTAEQASDMWAKAIESSNISPDAMASTLKRSALAAGTAGLDLPMLLSMLATETQSLGPGSESMVTRALMSASGKLAEPLDTGKLIAATKKTPEHMTYTGLAKELQDEGVSFDTVNSKSDSFLKKLVNLKNAGADFGKIFGVGLGSKMMMDLADHADAIEKTADAYKNSAGTAQESADKMADTWVESIKRMDAGIESLKEKIGGDLEPEAEKLVNFISGPMLTSINSFYDKLKSGDIKGAIEEAFNLGNLVLASPIPALDAWKNDILSYDWTSVGQEVAKDLGSEMSQINIDASKLGQTIAVGLAAALNFAEGLLGGADLGQILFGKTPLDSFLKPLEMIVGDEFRLLGAKMKLEMDKGSIGATQAIYSFHDSAITALAGILASVQMLAESFSVGLVNAINAPSQKIAGFDIIPKEKSESSSDSSSSSSGSTLPTSSGTPESGSKQFDDNAIYVGKESGTVWKGSDLNANNASSPGRFSPSSFTTDITSDGGSSSEGSSQSYDEMGMNTPGLLSLNKNSISALKQKYGASQVIIGSVNQGVSAQGVGETASLAANKIDTFISGSWLPPGGLKDIVEPYGQAIFEGPYMKQNLPGSFQDVSQETWGLKNIDWSQETNLGTTGTNFDSSAFTGSAISDAGLSISSNVEKSATDSKDIAGSHEKAKDSSGQVKDNLSSADAFSKHVADNIATMGGLLGKYDSASQLAKDTKDIDDAQNQLNTDLNTFKTTTENTSGPLAWLDAQMKDNLLTASILAGNLGKVDGAMGKAADTSVPATQNQPGMNVGYDALKDALSGCEETMSEFGKWQEANASTLFFGSYMGPSGAPYDEWKAGEAARGANHPAVDNLGYDYSQAHEEALQLSTVITKEEKKPVSLDDSKALASADSLQAELSQPAYKTVYVSTSGGSGGAGNLGNNTGNPILDQGLFESFENLPSFASGDVFVPRPTLALVGDRPGGEWIGGMDQAVQRFGGGQGQPTSVSVDLRGAYVGYDSVEKLADVLAEQIQHKLTML